MADFDVLFREDQRIPVIFNELNVNHYKVIFHKDEELGPVIFSQDPALFTVTFHEDSINDKIFGGVNYVVHDYSELPIATRQRLGCIIVGDNLSVEADGTLSADAAEVDALTNMEIEELLGGT